MKNSQIVFKIIEKSKKPLSAYLILDQFQKIKRVQPMAVYRPLNKLIDDGKIHKSNRNKTFILCIHNHLKDHNTSIAICKECGETEELKSKLFSNIFKKFALKNYDFSSFDLEVSTICKKCIN